MNTKNPILIVAVVFVLVGFGFYNFALKPKQKDADAIATKVDEAQGRLDAATALLASNTAAKDSFRSAYSTVVRLGKAVPGDDDVRSLVVQLDRASKSTFVDFQSIEVGSATAAPATSTSTVPTGSGAALPPGATIGPAGFPMMPFSFSFRGEFFRLGKFFQRLDAFVKNNNDRIDVTGRLLTVDALKLEPDTSGFPNVKATVQATSYLVSPLEGATGGATPAGPGAVVDPAAPVADTTTPPTTTASIR